MSKILSYLLAIKFIALLLNTSLFASSDEESTKHFKTLVHRQHTKCYVETERICEQWQNLPQDVINSIAYFARVVDIVTASKVCKAWYKKWNERDLWKICTQKIPGHERIESIVKSKNSGTPYKEIFLTLMQPQITIIDNTYKGSSYRMIPYVLSADGKVIAGSFEYVTLAQGWLSSKAFIWTQNEEIQILESLENREISQPTALSADGKILIGYAFTDASFDDSKAFIWTKEEGMKPFAAFEEAATSHFRGISRDNNFIVGSTEDIIAFIHRRNGEMQSLGILNGEGHEAASEARAVSDNGKVVTGNAKDCEANDKYTFLNRAFVWTEEQGLKSLGTLNGGNYSEAQALSADGKIVVGAAKDGLNKNFKTAIIWTEREGMKSLGTLNGGNFSKAKAISADGKIVVGTASDGQISRPNGYQYYTSPHKKRSFYYNERAFIWTHETGLISLSLLLKEILPADCVLVNARSINTDGTIIVGNVNEYKIYYAYIPRLDFFKKEGLDLSKLKKSNKNS